MRKNVHSWWGSIATLYVGWRVWLLCIAALAIAFIPIPTDQYLAAKEFLEDLPRWLTVWGNFDGAVFMRIARGGYGLPEVPFFPLLPLLLGVLHRVGIPFVIGGMIISIVSFVGVVWVWHALWKLDTRESRYKDLPFFFLFFILLSFPTAHYLTAVYQDSLFLFLGSAALLTARQRRWGWAVLTAVLATLARLNGLALFFVLGAEYMIELVPRLKKRWPWQEPFTAFATALHPKNLLKNPYVFTFIAIPGAFVLYLAYLQLKFGDWHVFFSSVEVWHRNELTFPLQTLWRYFKILILYAHVNFVYWVAWGEALFTGLYLLILGLGWGRIRFSYWVFICAHLTIPMLTGTLQGMPRYGLHLYPIFLVLAQWVWKRPRWVQVAYFLLMAVLQVLYVSAFVRGYFVA